MKKLSFKEILITFIISYLITAYIHSSFNLLSLESSQKVTQLALIGFSLFIQTAIKNLE